MRRAALGRLAILLAPLALGSACFQPPVDCRRAGLCECVSSEDCPEGLECINGFCGVLDGSVGPKQGEFGAPCEIGTDCKSGLCLPPGPGRTGVCTVECSTTAPCPGEWECKQSFADAGPARLCVPPFNALCLSCASDSECNAAGDKCLDVGGEKVCARDCSESFCPEGYVCQPLPDGDGGVAAKQCVPAAGTCECSDLTVGLGRGCKNASPAGTCYGFETCQSNGTWASCDAKPASKEICDGEDDDCDGLVDSNDPGVDTSSLPADPRYPQCRKGAPSGNCLGIWSCVARDGGADWVCGAPDPRVELCNGLDEDCNGVVDEPFKGDGGVYQSVHHCGACGFDCEVLENLRTGPDGGVAEGAVACEVRSGVATCAPKRCAPGFAPYPVAAPTMCLQAIAANCLACSQDADCSPFGDRCLAVANDEGTWCAQRCDVNAPYVGCTGAPGAQGCCPTGYTCEAESGGMFCRPIGDTCTCRPTRAGATRACVVEVPSASCLGSQTCGDAGEWGTCDTEGTTLEVCDSADNDCNGVIDDPFVNTRGTGTYDSDEHCGSCTTNCTALWSPTIQHAVGGCDAGPGRAPTCEIVRCTQEHVAGGGVCQIDADCGFGRICHPTFRQCVRACTSSTQCGGGSCENGFCTIACTSDSQCAATLGRGSSCGDAGTCGITHQFVNTDKDPTNGCECASVPGIADTPDTYAAYPDAGSPYVDRNCDGVDGIAATALFVKAGAVGGTGTRQSPFGTISQAIAAFTPGTHSAILVSAGSYVEQVVLKNGVHVHGGYNTDYSRRDVVAFPTLIEAPEPDFTSQHRRGSVNAESITSATTLAGFVIRGYDVTFRPASGTTGKNSYAVYVKDATSALTLANNRIVAGRGGEGNAGGPGAAGNNGGAGSNGLDSKECTNASCSNQSQSGGSGGTNTSCTGAAGNTGGSSSGSASAQQYQPPLGKNGQGGTNGTYQHTIQTPSNLCKYDCTIGGGTGMNGQAAQNGNEGASGNSGGGCTFATGGISGDEWVGAGGGIGAGGQAGTGGGGGGGGGMVENSTPSTCTVGNRVGDLGGTGGGGGGGGCGGSGGGGGAGGGGSFGVFIVFTAPPSTLPFVSGNVIQLGSGGAGGNGGAGGYGGAGGQGGAGGVAKLPAWCAGKGGPGGRGGNGGAGAGGGGGCGGAAVGIGGNFISGANYASRNTLVVPPTAGGGAPGAGGASPAGTGSAGGSGSFGVTNAVISF